MVLTVGDVTKTLAEWGLSAPMLYKRNMAACEFTVKDEGRAFDAEPLFAYGAEITVALRSGATSTVIFQGTRSLAPADASGNYEAYDYIFANGWKALEEITYGQAWKSWRTATGGPVSEFIETSEVHVFTEMDVNTGGVTRIHNGDTVRDVVEWAIAHGANLQVGTITPALWLPVEHKRDLKCSEVIQMALKLCPDVVVDIDDATSPPTFHCIQRAQMTGRSIALGDAVVTRLRLTKREDLQVPAVVLKYKRTDEIDGRPRHSLTVDRWPADATGFEAGAIFQTIDLFGGRLEVVRGTIESEELYEPELTTAQWWQNHGVTWLSGVTVVSVTPAAREGSLGYVLSPESGSVAPWMVDDDGNEAEAEMETFRAQVSYRVGINSGTEEISVRLKMTNLASGTYSTVASVESPEVAVAGLAQEIYNGLATAHWDGSVTVTEQECGTEIGLTNTLSITGGTGRYAAMNAVVQEIVYDLASGTRTFTVGWPKKLSLDAIIGILRFNRVRAVYQNPALQGTGEPSGGDGVELPDGAPMENAAMGAAQYRVFAAANGDNVVKLDGDNGLVSVTGATGAGSISLALAQTNAKDIRVRQYSVCVGGVTRKVMLVGSDYFD
jgi:hypothetical protein